MNIKFRCAVLLIFALSIMSCTPENDKCETETKCFGDGNCVERPIAGSCFD